MNIAHPEIQLKLNPEELVQLIALVRIGRHVVRSYPEILNAEFGGAPFGQEKGEEINKFCEMLTKVL